MQLDSISDASFESLRLEETAEISVKEAEGFKHQIFQRFKCWPWLGGEE